MARARTKKWASTLLEWRRIVCTGAIEINFRTQNHNRKVLTQKFRFFIFSVTSTYGWCFAGGVRWKVSRSRSLHSIEQSTGVDAGKDVGKAWQTFITAAESNIFSTLPLDSPFFRLDRWDRTLSRRINLYQERGTGFYAIWFPGGYLRRIMVLHDFGAAFSISFPHARYEVVDGPHQANKRSRIGWNLMGISKYCANQYGSQVHGAVTETENHAAFFMGGMRRFRGKRIISFDHGCMLITSD